MIQKIKFNLNPERYPLYCQWEITCRCNLHCVMCYTDCYNTPEKIQRELGTSEVKRILDEIVAEGCMTLCLTGGEPLARPDFFEIYEYAKSKGLLITLFTNGTLITEKEAARFSLFPPHRIEISMHGFSEETFDRITQGKGSYVRCMKAVKLLLERKIPVVLKTTAMSLNKDEILKIKDFVKNLGAAGYRLGEHIVPRLDGDTEPQKLQLSESSLLELKQGDAELWKETCGSEYSEMKPCESGKTRFHIDAYGQLQLCSGNRRQGYDLIKGSFREGFYESLPEFPCGLKTKRLFPAPRFARV